jgi:hypothetical protein
MAQVYSVNAVGYVNLTMKPKFNLIANQLIRSPDATLATLFPAVPVESQVFTYEAGLYKAAIYLPADGGWLHPITGAPSDITLNPGQGAFFYNASTPAADVTVTFVGDVPQGNVGLSFPQFFTLAASVVPQAITLTPANGLPDRQEAQFLTYDTTSQSYNTALYNDGGPLNGQVPPGIGWQNSITGDPATPTLTVGQGFFIYNPSAAAYVWTRTFSVN